MRATAFHVPLRMVASATPEEHGDRTFFRLSSGSLVKRVHVWGVVVNKIVGDEYVRLILDDFTGTAAAVFFDPAVEAARSVEIGDTITVIGRLRQRNDEIGIVGEVLKIVGPKVELLRRLENLAFALGAPREEEIIPAPAPKRETGAETSPVEAPQEEEEEIEVETLDLEGDEW